MRGDRSLCCSVTFSKPTWTTWEQSERKDEPFQHSSSSIRRLSKRQRMRGTMSKLNNKVAIVTGASKGIGAGIAKGLAAEGAAVVVNYATSKEGADRVVAEIVGKGGKAVAIQGDVANALDVRRIFAETKKAFGRLDVLVNNA